MGATDLNRRGLPRFRSCGRAASIRARPTRLLALSRYDLAGTPPEAALDRITSMAARDMAAPFAALAFVDADRIWCKAVHGLAGPVLRARAGCAGALLDGEPWIIEDAARDARAAPTRCWPPRRAEILCRRAAADAGRVQPRRALRARTTSRGRLGRADRRVCKTWPPWSMDVLELRCRLGGAEGRESREADHRVMNSLQFISAMLGLAGPRGRERRGQGATRRRRAARRRCGPGASEFLPGAGCALDWLPRIRPGGSASTSAASCRPRSRSMA